MGNLGPVELLVIIVIGGALAWATGAVARGKGYSFGLFAVLGFFFAPIPLVVAALLPQRDAKPVAGAPFNT